MKIALLAFCAAFAPAALMAQTASTAAARAVTLDEAYRLALAKSEALAQSAEGVKELAAARRRIRAAFLPALYGEASAVSAEKSAGKGQAGLNLSYDLFSGMRDYISIRAAGRRTQAAELALARARQDLYLNTAQAYISLSNVRQELAIRQGQLSVWADRIKELQRRESVGRSRKSEVVAAQAQLAQDDSALQNAKGREDFARLELGFLTGLEGELAPELLPVPGHSTREAYQLKAQKRFDVEAARKTLEAARFDVDAEKHLRWPSVSAGANYYFARPAANKNTDWDATVGLSLPLFTGGFIGASVDQAEARARSAEFALAFVVRQALTDVKEAYSLLHHSAATLESLTKALALAEENAKMQSRDYTYSLVTNLDVLNAQNTLLQTKLNLEQARAQACLAGIQLDVAAGGPEAP
ncbi:MAG: TolC family protein [Elusimicrobiota bacterium]|jgi:outer membrane protein